MLRLVKEDELRLRLEMVKSITICFKKWSKRTCIKIFELNNGDVLVFQENDGVNVESFGSSYIKDNNIKVKAHIDPKNELKRIVICSRKLMNKRQIEIIELTNGEVMIVPLSKSISTEKVDSEYIMSEFNKNS